MKLQFLTAVFLLQADGVYNCNCESDSATCSNTQTCVNCRMDMESDCFQQLSGSYTKTMCYSALINSPLYQMVDFKPDSDECRYTDCMNWVLGPSYSSNRTAYWKSCTPGCSSATVTIHTDSGVTGGTVTPVFHPSIPEEECSRMCLPPTQNCVSVYQNGDCNVYMGCGCSLQTVSGALAFKTVCTEMDCGILTSPQNGSVNQNAGTKTGDTASYSCDTGFERSGSIWTTCGSDGNWSNPPPICIIRDCGTPNHPGNGTLTYTTTTYQSTATYTCDVGYDMVRVWLGSTSPATTAVSMCDEFQILLIKFAAWSPSLRCDIKDCASPTSPSDGYASYTSTTYTSSATYSCNVGYTLTGSASTTCQADGTWSNSPPTCTIKDCYAPDQPVNGSVSYTTTTYGSLATYSCLTGYSMTGSDLSTCQADATWSTGPPICTILDCGDPSEVANGNVTYITTTYNNQATYTCNTGFSILGEATTTCGPSAAWTNPAPTCVVIDCGAPTLPEYGNATLLSTTYNNQVNYSCNVGYFLSGATSAMCSLDATWSNSPPTCTIVDCGSPVEPTNGSVISSQKTYGSIATYSCNNGNLQTGPVSTTCQSDGMWSDALPTCTYIDCGNPSSPTNGSVSYTTTYLNSIVSFNCHLGYYLVGSSTAFCCSDSNWNGSATCFPVDCGAPGSTSNGVVNYARTTFGEQANYTCDQGFTINGDSVITCLSTGLWDSSVPTCDIIDCGDPSKPINGTANFTATTFGSIATFVCDPGFTLSGSTGTHCGLSGTWNTTTPTCNDISCGPPSDIANGTVLYTATNLGSVATYSCNDGFFKTGVSELTCNASGLWNDTAPYCTTYNCKSPPDLYNGEVFFTLTMYESVAMYSCNEGFSLSGSQNAICGPTGSWDIPSFPSCTIVDCGNPTVPGNGTASFQNSTFGSDVNYSCVAGYILTGPSARTCLANSSWSGETPTCSIIDCGDLVPPTNGLVLYNETTYGETASYVCDVGYVMFGSSSRTCQQSGAWTPSQPICLLSGVTTTTPVPPKRLYIMPCLCVANKTFTNMTEAEIIEYLITHTSINTANTSAALDKLKCRADDRASSAVIGTLGIAMLSTVGGLMLCLDLLTICKRSRGFQYEK